MKNMRLAIVGFFMGSLLCVVSAQTRSITVTGTVQDSVSGQAIPNAMVLLYASATLGIDTSNLGSLQLDTATTGADGKFSYKMTVAQNAILLFYGVLAQNYQIKYNIMGILGSTVNLGIIKLKMADASSKDTITVSGKVEDSATSQPLGGAVVAMSGLGGLDTVGNTAITNADGTFSKQVIISKLNNSSVVAYIATKPGYTPKVGQATATGKQLDFGTILLKPAGNAVLPGRNLSFVKRTANGMRVYSLNGKLLYAGPIRPVDKVVRYSGSAVVVDMKRNGPAVDAKKVFPLQ